MESIKARAKRLMDCFNLTIGMWEIVDNFQGSVCALCGKKQKSGKRLATDHRHSDGLIRGLLCSQCNRLLGKIEGTGWTVGTLVRLIQYIQTPPAVTALGREVFGYAGRVGTKKHRQFLRRAKKKLLRG